MQSWNLHLERYQSQNQPSTHPSPIQPAAPSCFATVRSGRGNGGLSVCQCYVRIIRGVQSPHLPASNGFDRSPVSAFPAMPAAHIQRAVWEIMPKRKNSNCAGILGDSYMHNPFHVKLVCHPFCASSFQKWCVLCPEKCLRPTAHLERESIHSYCHLSTIDHLLTFNCHPSTAFWVTGARSVHGGTLCATIQLPALSEPSQKGPR